MILYAPVGVVANAADLADHKVGGGKRGIELGGVVLLAAVVVQEAPARALDQVAITGHASGAATDAQNRLIIQARNRLIGALGLLPLPPRRSSSSSTKSSARRRWRSAASCD